MASAWERADMDNLPQTKRCSKCGNDRAVNSKCQHCVRIYRQKYQQLTDSRVLAGICTACGVNRARKNKRRCESCSARYADHAARRSAGFIDAGKCSVCGGDKEQAHSRDCNSCRQKKNSGHEKFRQQCVLEGKCYRCCRARIEIYTLCTGCFFRLVSYKSTGTSKHADALRFLFEAQNRRCALTGELLTLGDGASIDHVVPKARGGACEPSNLRWVTTAVNKAKSDMLDSEFIEMCRKVVAVADTRPALKIAK